MQRMRLTVALLLTALLTAGCFAANAARRGEDGLPAPIVLRPGEFAIPEAIQAWVEALLEVEGVHVRREGDWRYVLVAMGERPSGGYRVDLSNATETEGYILLEVVYRAPGPGEMVTQALTYPYLLVAVPGEKEVRVDRLGDGGETDRLPVQEQDQSEPRPLPATPAAPAPGDAGRQGEDNGLVVLRPGSFELPETLLPWVEALRAVEGVYVRREGGLQYVLVAMGERPTGGYQVELNDALEAEDYVLLEVVYRVPGPGDMVIQAFTQPYLVLAVRTKKEIQVNRLGEDGDAERPTVYHHETAETSGLIELDRPFPFEGAGATIRVSGRVKTTLPVYAYAEDGHYVLLEETRLSLSAAGGGWMRFDQELTLRGSSSPNGVLIIGFGSGGDRVQTIIPLRMVEWSYVSK